MRLVVGRELLTEAGRAALPVLCRLCEALSVPTHWDEETETLYVKSPFPGRRVRVQTGTPGQPPMDDLVTALRRRLTQCGADCASPDPDLDLRLDLAARGEPGVWAAYGWTHETTLRDLASNLAWAAARHLELPVLETRPAPGSETPHITLRLAPQDPGRVTAESLVEVLLDALHSHWSPQEVPAALPPEPERMILDPDPALALPDRADEAVLAQVLNTTAGEREPDPASPAAGGDRFAMPTPGTVAPQGRTVPVVASFRRVAASRSVDPRRGATPATALPFQRAFPTGLPPEARVELPPPGPRRTPPAASPAPSVPQVLPKAKPEEAPPDFLAQVPPAPEPAPTPEPDPTPEPAPAPVTAPPARPSTRPSNMAQVITNNGVIIRIQK